MMTVHRGMAREISALHFLKLMCSDSHQVAPGPGGSNYFGGDSFGKDHQSIHVRWGFAGLHVFSLTPSSLVIQKLYPTLRCMHYVAIYALYRSSHLFFCEPHLSCTGLGN